jgi:hypothetical protein
MRHLLLTFGIAIAASGLTAQAPTLPVILQRGVSAYMVKGPDSAVAAWLKGSPALAEASVVSNTVAALVRIQDVYGKMIGCDAVSQVPVGAHVTRYYVVLLFEHGPIYCWFDVYASPRGAVVPAFLFNTKADQIFPPAYFAR